MNRHVKHTSGLGNNPVLCVVGFDETVWLGHFLIIVFVCTAGTTGHLLWCKHWVFSFPLDHLTNVTTQKHLRAKAVVKNSHILH